MDTIYVLRGRIQEVYARHTKIIDKAGPVSYTHLTLPTNSRV